MKLTERLEAPVIRMLKRYFQAQHNFVLRRLREVLGGKSHRREMVDVEQFLWDSEEAKAELERRLSPLLINTVQVMGEKAIADLGLEIAFDVEHPGVRTGLREQVTKVVGLVDQTTRDAVRATLTEGLAAGEGVTGLADRISLVFEAAKGRRAETIARTETNEAASIGTQEAWRQTGAVKKKRWISALDERTRTPDKGGFDHVTPGLVGETVPLDASFHMTGEALRYPGDSRASAGNRISCRCVMAAVTASED